MKYKSMVKEPKFYLFIFFILLGSFLSFEVMRAETASLDTEKPIDIQSAIDELRKRVHYDLEENKRRKLIVNDIYSWIRHEFVVSSGKKAVTSSRKTFPLISDQRDIQWKKRSHFRYKNIDKTLLIDELSWKTQEDDLLITQIDYMTFLLDKKYMRSAPPQIFLKKKLSDKIIIYDLNDWKYSGLGSTFYTVHGFVHRDGVVCPDVLISMGPVGSGSFVYFVQMHYDNLMQHWVKVWEFWHSYIINVEYPDKNGKLSATYIVDKYKGNETNTIFFQLKWGEQPDHKFGSHLKENNQP